MGLVMGMFGYFQSPWEDHSEFSLCAYNYKTLRKGTCGDESSL